MTDPHIYPGNNAPEQIAQAIRHMHSPNMKVDEILCGGDCIMDALKVSKEDTRTQWKLWQDVIEAEVNLPFHTCIGNHDVWGWAMKEGQKDKGEYGKKWAMDELGLKERYYHFTRNNWDFLVLDSVYTSFQTSRGYTAKLDDEQFAWLEGKLQDIPKNRHICVLSHIPILCLSSFFDGPNEKSGNWVVPHEWMHIDARRIKTLFHQHNNIKACLSGHIHLQDKVEYLDIQYFCNGAVSGNWWNPKEPAYQEFMPAYAVMDFYCDGRVDCDLVPYHK